MGHLILNDTSDTFTFDTTDPYGTAETCTGSYTVENDIAHIVNPMRCTQVVPAHP